MGNPTKQCLGAVWLEGFLGNWNPIPRHSFVWFDLKMGIGIHICGWNPSPMGFWNPSRDGGILNSIKDGIRHLPFYSSPATASPATAAGPHLDTTPAPTPPPLQPPPPLRPPSPVAAAAGSPPPPPHRPAPRRHSGHRLPLPPPTAASLATAHRSAARRQEGSYVILHFWNQTHLTYLRTKQNLELDSNSISCQPNRVWNWILIPSGFQFQFQF